MGGYKQDIILDFSDIVDKNDIAKKVYELITPEDFERMDEQQVYDIPEKIKKDLEA